MGDAVITKKVEKKNSQKKNNARLPDIQTLIQAGIDPKTRLPLKMVSGKPCNLENDLVRFLRVIDEQDALNRGTWYNLPSGITSQELERMLYYKGQLAFFYMEETDKFYFMPYALEGTIDFYGRFNNIHPVPFANGTDLGPEYTKAQKKAYRERLNNQREILSKMNLKCVYEPILWEKDIDYETLTKSCVLLHDYSKQLSQTIIPRATIQEPLIKHLAEYIPLMRTALIAASGVTGVKVDDADQKEHVNEGSAEFENAAKTGKIWIPIIGTIDFQELSRGTTKIEDYLLAMQSVDNFRLSGYGIDNGGLFEKKAHELEVEAAINGGPIGLVMQDYVSIRQHFCNVVNSIWGLGIWYEPSENLTGTDVNGDGLMYDRASETETTPEEGGMSND